MPPPFPGPSPPTFWYPSIAGHSLRSLGSGAERKNKAARPRSPSALRGGGGQGEVGGKGCASVGGCGELAPVEPRLGGLLLRLEGVDLGGLGHRDADVVEPVQQPMLAEGLDLETDGLTVRPRDGLGLQVHRH